jgi:hypothetical protein
MRTKGIGWRVGLAERVTMVSNLLVV